MRTIPYGYAVQNGANVINQNEAIIVRSIFHDYTSELSLLSIAKSLTLEKVEFLNGRFDWNKNRVKRILEDKRYIGDEFYPALVSEETYNCSNNLKNERAGIKGQDGDLTNHEKDNTVANLIKSIFRGHCIVECSCGAKMKRRHDPRRKVSQQLWNCQNSNCKNVVNINDEVLLEDLTELMNLLRNKPSIIIVETVTCSAPPIEIRRLENEVNRQLDSIDFDKDKLKKSIFTLAAEKYRYCDEISVISKMIKSEFENANFDEFPLNLFRRTVKKVVFESNQPVIVLKNNQKIRKEPINANCDAT